MSSQRLHRRFSALFSLYAKTRAKWGLLLLRLVGYAFCVTLLVGLPATPVSAGQTHSTTSLFQLQETPRKRPAPLKTALAHFTPPARPTPSPTQSPTPVSPTPTWTHVPTAPPPSTPTPPLLPPGSAPTATSRAAAGQTAPRVLITEFLANPAAVADSAGEWLEIYNADSAPVNLNGWTIADLGSDAHVIGADLIVPPGAHVVLARNGDPATNGGVPVDYVYAGISMANGGDELLLLAPDGTEADRVEWGGATGLSTTDGASLQRTSLIDPAQWATAQTVWSGSAGDRGTPGTAYVPPPTATPTVPLTSTVTPSATLPLLLITEVMANPAAVADAQGEYIEIWNGESAAVNLNGWTIADLGTDSHTINTDLVVSPGGYVVLARNGDSTTNGGVPVDYVYSGINLSNSADEVLLLAPSGEEVDRIEWGSGTGLSVTAGASLERTASSDPAAWVAAQTPWPGSAGDAGSPGAGYIAPPSATPTPTSVAGSMHVLISEVMPDPAAVADGDGEWFELYNGGDAPVNLNGWTVADLGTDQHMIAVDLVVFPGEYVVLARNDDPATNGGVPVDHVYSGVSLSNSGDELLLFAPDGSEVDRVVWGGGNDLSVTAGASLERTTLSDPTAWVAAQTPWPGSAGDAGSPGAGYVAPPTPTPTATAGPALPLYLSEVMADPQAVADSVGEWLEIFNPNAVGVNLRGWRLVDLGSDAFVVDGDVMVDAGGYALLARNGDQQTNGGVAADFVYSGMSLSNSADEVILLAPDGMEMDRVAWGPGTEWRIRPGASLERVSFTEPGQWVTAQTPWPGSAGDAGSPGMGYVPPSLTPTPTMTPAPAEQWTPVTAPSPLQIDEVAYRGSDEEYVAIINVSEAPVSLAGWSLGDAQAPDSGEGLYALPDDVQLLPGEIFIVARNGAAFRQAWRRLAHAETGDGDPDTPTLARRRELASGQLALSDSGDEVVLLDAAGRLADAVAFGSGDYALLGLAGEFRAATGFTLQRVPGAQFPIEPDVRHRFLAGPPEPFAARGLPQAQAQPSAALDGGLTAVWGTLGAQSNFTPGYTAPPHYMAAAAAAERLHFLALADPAEALGATDGVHSTSTLVRIPAWRWQGADDAEAVVYSTQSSSAIEPSDFLAFLRSSGSIAQWQEGTVPSSIQVVGIGADDVEAPGGINGLFADWSAAGLPLLPAGNSNPPLPGVVNPAPRYTGLAVSGPDAAGVQAALVARRGWVTNRSGLWLTLGAQLESGEWRWMGQHAPAANQITLHVHYGDAEGQLAGLALWRDGQPIRQLDLPPGDGRWAVTIPALPGSFLYAVATQLDGDFAVTAPIRILPGGDGSVVINEVLPSPGNDHNGDGEVNSNDEFVELLNPGTHPVGLADWQLSDDRGDASPGSRFTFGADDYIGGGERLLLWRKESGLSLNDGGDYVRLLDATGAEVDVVRWAEKPESGHSFSRVPDGQTWHADTPPTPGEPNREAEHESEETDSPSEKKPSVIAPRPENDDDEADPVDHQQAAGPPNSLTSAKRLGLERWVEFRARVVVPPGLFNSSIYVADPAPAPDGPHAGLGINVYLWRGSFPPLQEGDQVVIRGETDSFRGEMEVFLRSPEQIWRIGPAAPLLPLPIQVDEVGESLEGRLVTFTGAVRGWSYDSIYLGDPSAPDGESVRVAVRSSLDWRRPYVNNGELWQVTGVVSQLAQEAPWNGGYRVLVRYQDELVQVEDVVAVATTASE